MRFSELKKLKETSAPPPARKSPPEPVPFPAPPAEQKPPEPLREERAEARKPEPAPPEIRPAKAPPAPPQAAPREQSRASERRAQERKAPAGKPYRELETEAREIYARLLRHSAQYLKASEEPYTEKYETTLALASATAASLKENPALLGLTAYSTADDYLRGHTANTFALVLAMGLEAGLERQELGLLGFCAMAHDAGMTGFSSLYNTPGRLGDSEMAEMTLHAEAGAAKLDRVLDLDYKVKDRARRVVLQVHERDDGSGYPDRLSSEEIDPLAQMIGIADAYEAMSHPRPWRDALPPHEAVKELIEKEGRGFNSGPVKLLLASLSMFPPGSLVVLSTGETARVLMPNRGLLTRPVVEILLHPDHSPAEGRLTDLKEHPLVSVERAITPAELRERNQKCAARMELARWWTDW